LVLLTRSIKKILGTGAREPPMMESPEAAEAMEYDGVIPETVVFLVERE
jgi:hypothetical protein